MDTANTRANADTYPDSVFLAQVQVSILYSHFAAGNSELGNPVHSLAFLAVAVFGEIKALNFPGNFAGKVSGIKLRDQADPGFACNQVIPEFILTNTNGSNGANTGHNHSTFQKDHLLFRIVQFFP